MANPTTTLPPTSVCTHKNFHADVNIDTNFGPTGFACFVFVRCRDCGKQFHFPTPQGVFDRLVAPIQPAQ